MVPAATQWAGWAGVAVGVAVGVGVGVADGAAELSLAEAVGTALPALDVAAGLALPALGPQPATPPTTATTARFKTIRDARPTWCLLPGASMACSRW
jgi:tryptophan synthase beta subunit